MHSPAVVVALVAGLLLTGAPSASASASVPSAADSPYSRDAPRHSQKRMPPATIDPLVGLRGRGFGHGRGMSQWGARGAAEQGLTFTDILRFYYPGTTVGSLGDPTIRVRLTAMTGQATAVAAEPGLTLTDGTCTAALTRSGASSWRVLRSGSAWQVQGHWTSATGTTGWWAFPTTCAGFATAAGLMFVGDGSVASSVLTLRTPGGNRDYRGGLRATTDNRPGTGQVITVNHLSMNRYLQSVVPAEIPEFWHAEAVKAQSVAARSYAAASLGKAYSSDICDTTSCQVYPGLTTSHPGTAASDAAVAATTGQILRYGSGVALTEFGSTNGGQIAGSSLPYQVAKPDPYDGALPGSPTTWNRPDVAASTIQSRWPALGTLRSLAFTRDGKGASFGGRVTSVTLVGTSASVTLTGEAFRSGLGLRSTYLVTTGSSVGNDHAGNGFADLVARDSSGVLWNYPGNGRGGWLPRTRIASSWPDAPEVLAPGDVSGDGIPDLLSRSMTTGVLTLHRGGGAGTVVSSASVGSGWGSMTAVVAPGDLDGDGAADVLARDAAGTMWLYPGTGTGGWKPRVSKGGGWSSLRELEAVGDADRDGGSDLVGMNTDGSLFLLRFSAAGAYLGAKPIGTGWRSYTAFTGMGDVDGDGAVDLVARDAAGGLWAHRGNGTGGFGTRVSVGQGWSTLTFGS